MTASQTAKLEQLIEVIEFKLKDIDRDITRAVADLRYALDNLATRVHDFAELGARVDRLHEKRGAQFEKLRTLQLVRDAA